ncbi:MAG: radical SAM protein [Phycisphaerae bacterium]|nr:radical SAM protein [Phycisphaerae bacterium]
MGTDEPSHNAARDHRRQWRDCLYVYPVVARRSRGLSIGVNLNPNKQCTFGCLYCQINRGVRRDLTGLDLRRLRSELRYALLEATEGALWDEDRFAGVPDALRRVNDIAFSGDGEPTCVDEFDKAVRAAVDAKTEFGREDIKIVVITNASRLDAPQVRRALPTLDRHNGEIWAKLDAGTEAFFERVNRPYPRITLRHVLENIRGVARERPVVIQTLLFRLEGTEPPEREIDAYAARLREILDGGGRIKLVQLHTIARAPASPAASALPDDRLDAIAARVRAAVPEVPVEVFYGAEVPPQQRGR